MNPVDHPSFDQHESVVSVEHPETGLTGYIAIHSTALGPAIGGCRLATYPDEQSALDDALRLSRGMSYKNAMAGLPAGGGKAVIHRVGEGADRSAMFAAFGKVVQNLGGQYITAQDVGTSTSDMQAVASATRFVAGLPNQPGVAGGDPSPWTALGVFLSIQACADRPLQGARVAVQGAGSVGYRLCELLNGAGARIAIADLDPERAARVGRDFGAAVVPIERIHTIEADVFSPNALGAVLTAETIPELNAPVVCGGANNQLATSRDGARLFRRGITYAPDYVVNAGGIINVMAEFLGEPESEVEARVHAIPERVRVVLERARLQRRPNDEVADEIARERIDAAVGRPLS